MSFSADTKAELCKAPLSRRCCALAECYGILLCCHTFSAREIRIITASPALAQRLPRLFRRAFELDFDQRPPESARGKRSFLITDPDKIRKIFSAYGQEPGISLHINLGALEKDIFDTDAELVFADGNVLAMLKAKQRRFSGIEISLPSMGYTDVIPKTHLGIAGGLLLCEQVINGLPY